MAAKNSAAQKMEQELAYSSVESDREIVVSRVINAPRELVFDAWTDAKHISYWWGPRGFTTTTHSMDVALTWLGNRDKGEDLWSSKEERRGGTHRQQEIRKVQCIERQIVINQSRKAIQFSPVAYADVRFDDFL
jgi:Activator of Hsp90 ATPase homolog 1-like protein